MKALILAAGLGTRLLPYTRTIPKPLFTLGSIPVLQHVISQLIQCGCRHILINTHHLSSRIRDFVDSRADALTARIEVVHEPEILDTGGAIANVRSVMADAPFFVINADVATQMDLAPVWHHHNRSRAIATLVLLDRKEFNQVTLDADGFIQRFDTPGHGLTFTGIQVVSPQIFDHLPSCRVFSSIDLYSALCPARQIQGYVAQDIFWEDIGTPAAYSRTARQWMSAQVLGTDIGKTQVHPLAGDGSDRVWFRARPTMDTTPDNLRDIPSSPGNDRRSVIVSDHGICLPGSEGRGQLDAFVAIGNHLSSCGIPVPEILAHDALAGMVVLEDLGDTRLAETISWMSTRDEITRIYKTVIDQLILFSRKGAEGFDLSWTCQTPYYSKELILEKECRYFMDAFVCGYLKNDIFAHVLENEFAYIADNALAGSMQGLMHRDCQSRNIMVTKNNVYFIDFQSARMGPFQYDLASLLMDPYVTLPAQIQKDLLAYAMEQLGLVSRKSRHTFTRSYHFCCLTRNMQILGAFAHLSRMKNKPGFLVHIPAAIASLKHLMQQKSSAPLVQLKELILNSNFNTG
jgi:aminoglycoside/choline kinase family phosphotransferase/dTDP-glucose pyrophosphorylase